MKLYLLVFSILYLSFADARQFVSTGLCLDRLLIELADDSQIASLSFLSKDPYLMLENANEAIPVNDSKLSSLVPYIKDTILVSASNRLLIEHLKKLGFDLEVIDWPQTKPELIQTIRRIATLTGQPQKAETLIKSLNVSSKPFKDKTILGFAEQGVVYKDSATFNQLIKLLGGQNKVEEMALPETNKLGLEQLLKIKSDIILLISYNNANYSLASALLEHDAIRWKTAKTPTLYLQSRYTLCFDQGVWQGANVLQKEYSNK